MERNDFLKGLLGASVLTQTRTDVNKPTLKKRETIVIIVDPSQVNMADLHSALEETDFIYKIVRYRIPSWGKVSPISIFTIHENIKYFDSKEDFEVFITGEIENGK